MDLWWNFGEQNIFNAVTMVMKIGYIYIYICSDWTILGIHSDIVVGDYVLCAGPATDSVPRLHSNLSYPCMRLPPGQVVASCGGRGSYSV